MSWLNQQVAKPNNKQKGIRAARRAAARPKKRARNRRKKAPPGGLLSTDWENTSRIPAHVNQLVHGISDIAKGNMNGFAEAADSLWLERKSTRSRAPQLMTAPASTGYRISGNRTTARPTVISHVDYMDATTSMTTEYNTREFVMNPGNSDTFPWLATLARRFELFEILDLCFHFTPTSSTQTPGLVALFWEPDWNDAVPTTSTQLMNNEYVSGGSAWLTHTLRIPNKMFKPNNTNAKRVRTDDSDLNERESHDFGRFYFITDNGTATENIGMLSVSYRFAFRVPQFHPIIDGYLHLQKEGAVNLDAILSVPNVSPASNLVERGLTFTQRTFTFPQGLKGVYHLLLRIGADGGTGIAPQLSGTSTTVTGGVTVHDSWLGFNTPTDLVPTAASSEADRALAQSAFKLIDVHVDGDGGTLEVFESGIMITGYRMDCMIYEVPTSHSFAGQLNSLANKLESMNRTTQQALKLALQQETKLTRCSSTTPAPVEQDDIKYVVAAPEANNAEDIADLAKALQYIKVHGK